MPDFGLLGQMPNFAQAAMSGYQAGQQIGRQKQLDAAMAGIDLDRPETLLPLLRADPATGAALIGASTKLAAEKRDREGRLAQATYLKAALSGGGSTGTTSTVGAPTSAPATAVLGGDGDLAVTSPMPQPVDPQAAQPGDVVVNGPPQNPNAARDAAIDADPGAFLEISAKLNTMDEGQRKRVADASDAFASIGQLLLTVPYAQRAGVIQAHAADLVAHGVPPEKIRSFDPTDNNIHLEVGQALGIKGQLERADKDRSFGLEQQRFQHTVQHDTVTEHQGDQRIGLEAQSVGIAGGHLAIARHADARAAASASAAGGGGGAGGAGIPAPTSAAERDRLPKGTRYRAPDGSIKVRG